MRHIATIVLCFNMLLSGLSAQNCIPDTLYRDSTAGVYPGPITPTNPNGGIDTFACIGQPFEFVFTVIIPDTFSFNGLLLNLLSAQIEEQGAVSGLPDGISYSCNPPDCIFPADSIGCIVLQGIPTANNTAGEYEPVITMTINTNIFPITTSFPGAIFPGKYILELRDENCMLTGIHSFALPDGWNAYPNPVEDNWNLRYMADGMVQHQLIVSDITGRMVLNQEWTASGTQELSVPVGDWGNGMYIYRLTAGDRMVSGRLIVSGK